MIDIRQAMTDPQLFGPIFGGDSFAAWRALLSGFYGLELDATELDTFKALTGRQSAPQGAFAELWLAIGRRGGKSHAAAFLAVYLAAFQDYRDKLAPGEVATVMVIAADRKQARAVMRYTSGLMNENPMLRRMVLRENSEQIELNNRTVIEITTASHRSVRGYTLAACICDEIAFWHVEGASPDVEIIAAIRPALGNAWAVSLIGVVHRPYARRGVLWDAYRRALCR
jgi:phage terminase large subunit-like protein